MSEALELMKVASLAISLVCGVAAIWQSSRGLYDRAAFMMAMAIFLRMVGHA